MSGALGFILIISIVIIFIVFNFIYSNKKKKKALAAKPADNRIYRVFSMDIDGKTYYVIKKYVYDRMAHSHFWLLQLDFSAYKDMTREDVIELCEKFNNNHLEKLNNSKITNIMESELGTMLGELDNYDFTK